MFTGIRHIIFDLGGVLLNIDYQLTEKAFVDLGIKNFNELYSQARQTDIFDQFETGRMSGDEFCDALLAILGRDIPTGSIISAWNAMLLDFPLRRLQLLEQLRLHYDLVLLSNTNAIHEAAFNKRLLDARGMPLGAFFDRVYLSHRIGMRKPSVEVFHYILQENGFQAEHTLFIDDSIQHVLGAREAGLHAIHLEKGMTIEEHIFLPKKQ